MQNNYTSIPIITRASEIIDYIGKSHSGKSASDLLKKFHLPKTTCYRMLYTLVEYEFLIRDDKTGFYHLGQKFTDFSTALDHKYNLLREISHPHLETLSKQTQETAKLSVLSNMTCYILDKADGPRNIKIHVDIGTTFPLHAGASSKIIFLSMGNRTRENIFEQGLERFTPNTITDKTEMLAEFEKIKKLGYSLDKGEYIPGIGAIACPVYDYAGKIIAAVSVAYATIIGQTTIESFIPFIITAAQKISTEFSMSCNHATLLQIP